MASTTTRPCPARLAVAALTALAWALAIAAALTWSGGFAGAAPGPTVVPIEAVEFKFEPQGKVELKAPASGSGSATLLVPAGEIVFKVTNAGAIEHNFIVWDKNQKTLGEIPVLASGETQELRMSLEPGRYTIVCTYPGHSELGMILALEAR